MYDAKDACEFAMRGIREGLDDETICQNLVRARIYTVPAARIDTMRKRSRRMCTFSVFLSLREGLDDGTICRNLARARVNPVPVTRMKTIRERSRCMCIFIVFLLLREGLDEETVRQNLAGASIIACLPCNCCSRPSPRRTRRPSAGTA